MEKPVFETDSGVLQLILIPIYTLILLLGTLCSLNSNIHIFIGIIIVLSIVSILAYFFTYYTFKKFLFFEDCITVKFPFQKTEYKIYYSDITICKSITGKFKNSTVIIIYFKTSKNLKKISFSHYKDKEILSYLDQKHIKCYIDNISLDGTKILKH